MVRKAQLLRRLDAGLEHVVVRDGRERAGQMVLARPVRIRAGALPDDDIAQVDVLLHRAGRADAHDIFHAEDRIQLPGINADGRHAHAGGHDGNFHAMIRAGIAVDAADVIDEDGIFQKVFRNELRPQRVAGHENGSAKIAGFGIDMRSRIISHIIWLLSMCMMGKIAICGFFKFASWSCLRRPILFRLAGKDRGEKGRLLRYAKLVNCCVRITAAN